MLVYVYLATIIMLDMRLQEAVVAERYNYHYCVKVLIILHGLPHVNYFNTKFKHDGS